MPRIDPVTAFEALNDENIAKMKAEFLQRCADNPDDETVKPSHWGLAAATLGPF